MSKNKKCADCKETKSLNDFYFVKTTETYTSYCKICHVGRIMKTRKTNKRKCSLEICDSPHYALGYCRMHHARYRYGNKKNLTRVFDGATDSPRNLRKYGITAEDFQEMSKDGCQICGVKNAPFVIDHDHSCCNEVPYCGDCTRGYVCHSCNISISKYEQAKMRHDNPLKESVIRYLINHDIRTKQKGIK